MEIVAVMEYKEIEFQWSELYKAWTRIYNLTFFNTLKKLK